MSAFMAHMDIPVSDITPKATVNYEDWIPRDPLATDIDALLNPTISRDNE